MTLEETRSKIEDWHKYYNEVRPHGATGTNIRLRCRIPMGARSEEWEQHKIAAWRELLSVWALCDRRATWNRFVKKRSPPRFRWRGALLAAGKSVNGNSSNRSGGGDGLVPLDIDHF